MTFLTRMDGPWIGEIAGWELKESLFPLVAPLSLGISFVSFYLSILCNTRFLFFFFKALHGIGVVHCFCNCTYIIPRRTNEPEDKTGRWFRSIRGVSVSKIRFHWHCIHLHHLKPSLYHIYSHSKIPNRRLLRCSPAFHKLAIKVDGRPTTTPVIPSSLITTTPSVI